MMMRSGALLLLLAVAAHQVDLSLTAYTEVYPVSAGVYRFSACPITFYGRPYESLHVSVDNSTMKLCFKDTSEPEEACLVVEDSPVKKLISVYTNDNSSAPGSPIHSLLPSITSASKCSVELEFGDNPSATLNFLLHNFDTQTVFEVEASDYPAANFTVKGIVGNFTAGPWGLNGTRTYMELSGCRLSGSVLLPEEVRSIPESCSVATCNATAVLSISSECGDREFCEDSICFRPDFVCAVTGPTVINVFGNLASIPDRCNYGLMSPEGNKDFSLSARFQERRRKDVPFLDSLLLRVGSAPSFELLQGGRVQNDGRDLILNSTAQLIDGLELSKDKTGITAKILSYNITVSFDGYTALVSGPDEALMGLCGDPTDPNFIPTPGDTRFGDSSCEIKHNDTVDSAINCTFAAKRCGLMYEAAFADCHDRTDPEPFVNACKRTLCKYPTVDGLNCQFFKAYAEACSIRGKPVGDWRSAVGCSAAPETFCQDRYCSRHEFCGEIPDGRNRCYCRAIFASKYREDGSLGEPTLCRSNTATLTLANCLLEDRGVDYSLLHLNDKTCTGDMDPSTHMVTFKFDEFDTCGAEVMMNNSEVIYKNTIMSRNNSMNLIIRHDEVLIDFSCYYPKPELRTVAFRIRESSVVQQITSGIWNYTLVMNAYTDPGLNNLIRPSTEIQLNQKIWVELRTQGLDENLVAVVTDSCWATSQPESDASLRYDLIINRCPNPADGTVNMQGNGLGTSNFFSFNMFQFSGKTSDVYLHCKLELCLKGRASCATNCGRNRRKRSSFSSKHADESPALITMAWTK